MGELGYKKLDIDFWHMLLAARRDAAPTIDKRQHGALHAALADARVQKIFADGGMDLFGLEDGSLEAAKALLACEIKLWGGGDPAPTTSPAGEPAAAPVTP